MNNSRWMTVAFSSRPEAGALRIATIEHDYHIQEGTEEAVPSFSMYPV
jgi:hypothetical protein